MPLVSRSSLETNSFLLRFFFFARRRDIYVRRAFVAALGCAGRRGTGDECSRLRAAAVAGIRNAVGVSNVNYCCSSRSAVDPAPPLMRTYSRRPIQ